MFAIFTLGNRNSVPIVIPASLLLSSPRRRGSIILASKLFVKWIPAYAGMTMKEELVKQTRSLVDQHLEATLKTNINFSS